MNFKFTKNKKYYSSLREDENGYYVCKNPLFICKDKGLFPVYRINGRQGVMNVNYHELIFKDIPKEVLKRMNHKVDYDKINQNTKNVLSFREEDWNI